MLTRVTVRSTVAGLVVASSLAACGTRDAALQAIRAGAPQASPSATPAVADLAWPDAVLHPLHLTGLASGGKAVTCERNSFHGWIDVPAPAPTDVRKLAAQSPVIVVATAVEARGYWQVDDGHLPAPNPMGMNAAILTATHFTVERVVRGAPMAALQVIDPGANPSTVASCPGLASVFRGWPLPVVGQRYVLFLQHDAGRSLTRDVLGPLDFFPIANGMVHSPFGGPDVPLDAFLSDQT